MGKVIEWMKRERAARGERIISRSTPLAIHAKLRTALASSSKTSNTV